MKILMIAAHHVHSIRPLNWLLDSGCEVAFVGPKDPKPEGNRRYQFFHYAFARGTRFVAMFFGKKISDRILNIRYSIWLRRIWSRVQPAVTHAHGIDRKSFQCVKAGIKPLVLSVWGSDVNDAVSPNTDPAWRRIVGASLAGADLVFIDAQDMVEKCSMLAGPSCPYGNVAPWN